LSENGLNSVKIILTQLNITYILLLFVSLSLV
jgi:hypothetical protein